MRMLSVFETISLDGFFSDTNGDMSFAHRPEPEWDAFVTANAKNGGELVFGRKTYEQMASFWPTPAAAAFAPELAAHMNRLPKVVFSRTLREASWENTTLVKDDIVATVRAMKARTGPELVVMGSGTVVSALAEAGLVDSLELVVVPVVLGRGRGLFAGVDRRLDFALATTRSFPNGNVVLTYERKT